MTTLYLLRDGTYADPKDCFKDKGDGVLKHKNGVAVALKSDGEPETMADATATNAQAASPPADKIAEEEKAA